MVISCGYLLHNGGSDHSFSFWWDYISSYCCDAHNRCILTPRAEVSDGFMYYCGVCRKLKSVRCYFSGAQCDMWNVCNVYANVCMHSLWNCWVRAEGPLPWLELKTVSQNGLPTTWASGSERHYPRSSVTIGGAWHYIPRGAKRSHRWTVSITPVLRPFPR